MMGSLATPTLTQASSVRAAVGERLALLGTKTTSFASKDKADPPNFAAPVQVGSSTPAGNVPKHVLTFTMDGKQPVFPLPLLSEIVVPAPSSRWYTAPK